MTDQELIARLLDWEEYSEGKINDARQEAADRIRELKVELGMLKGFIAGLEHVSYDRGGAKHIVTEIRQKAKDLGLVRDEVEEDL